MGKSLDIQPQDAWKIRNAMATQVAAHVLAALPIGYWQRRVAARAWSLETMPVIPRESHQVQAWRQPGPPATWVLSTDVMIWGLIPWLWRADPRVEVAEARRALQRFARVASRPACAAIFIAPQGAAGPRLHLPRLRMADAGSASMAVGVITWRELCDVFDEATTEVASTRGRDAAAYGATQLALLMQAASG
jgi:hypothetical protein